MAGKRIIAICMSGGEFQTGKDGSLAYIGGDAHAIDVDDHMKFGDFQLEIAEMFNCTIGTMSVKYFLPGNKKTLITISNDKDLKRMIKFHGNSDTADVYILTEEALPDVSNMPASRSSRTTLSEAIPMIIPSMNVLSDIMDDAADLDIPLSTGQIGMVEDSINDIDAHLELLPEMSPVLPIPSSSNERQLKGAHQWQNTITGVGQRFNSVGDFRESLRKYAIAHQFAYRYKKNDSHRVTVKCKAEGCPWRIHASRLSTTQLICIKKMNSTHTCEGAGSTNGHQASRSWVASIIKEKLKVSPNYKPKDIVNDIKEEYGIQLKYFQAWRGKEIAKEQLQGSYKEAYKQLPVFCESIMETNPGSLATFTTKEDSSFHRLFVSFHASLYGFLQGCRPLIFLDSIPLKSKYQGTLLAATSVDGDDGVFPLAFAVVDSRTDDNWRWFLIQLKSALSTTSPITFVADRQKGLRESIAETFEGGFHAYCLRHLTDELIQDLKGPFSHEVKRLMVDDFFAAANASRPEDFHRHVENIKSISPEAYDWILHKSQPANWANAYFQGMRYNHMTSNLGEPFYSWASEAHELPITQMVELIRGKIMDLILSRRVDSSEWDRRLMPSLEEKLEKESWERRLTPSMEEKLEKESLKVHTLHVAFTADNTFQVRGETFELVNMDRLDCSCKRWQLSGLPCVHALAVISCMGRSAYDFCSRYFTIENFKTTYSQSVHPIPSLARESRKDRSGVMVTPPPTRRPPGRPSIKKLGSEDSMKRQLQCSKCKGLGHNKSTCKDYSMEC